MIVTKLRHKARASGTRTRGHNPFLVLAQPPHVMSPGLASRRHEPKLTGNMTLGILQKPSFSPAPYSQEVTPTLCAIYDANHLTDRCLAPPTLLLHILEATRHKQFCSRGRVTTLGAEADLAP